VKEVFRQALGDRLRAVRLSQGLTLREVEQRSAGRWKGIVVGSYERGDRAMTVVSLADLAHFYGLTPAELLPRPYPHPTPNPDGTLVLDLQQLSGLSGSTARPLRRFIEIIQSQRSDHNGRIVSLRATDLRSLAVIYNTTPPDMIGQLADWGFPIPHVGSILLQHAGSVHDHHWP